MKKKLMAVILSVMMLVCFAATAMAAPAPSPSADVKISTVKAVVDGKEVEIDLSNLKITVTDSAVKEELNTSDKIAAIAGDAAKDMALARLFEVTYTGSAFEKITITFEVAGVKAGENVLVLHKAGDAWETITPDSVDNNSVTATFTSLSPVAILVNYTSNAATSATSPKTGADMSMVAVEVMAVAFVGLAVVAGKKAKRA
ncbi:MAG: hypothetical protein UIT84_04290 [Lachnospiraceae bacterium]